MAKTVENKKTSLKKQQGSDDTLNYADLIQFVIDKPMKDGITLDQMEKDLRVIRAAKKANKEEAEAIELEDADFTHLLEAVKASKWGTREEDLLEFGFYIKGLQKAS